MNKQAGRMVALVPMAQKMSLRDIDLNLLVTLEALLRERNVTRAGQVLGASQPAMSAALARLRDLFQDQLLLRVGREYRLTPMARDLVGPLQSALATLQGTLERRSGFDPQSSTREFRIATSDYVMAVLMQPFLAHLRDTAPGIRLHLRNADSAVQRKLINARIDLSIQPAGVLAHMPGQVLFSDEWVCAVWSGNADVSDPMTIEQWSRLPHACFGFGSSGIVLADLMLGPLAEARTRQVVCESYLTLPYLLPQTRLMALLPSRIARLFASNGQIRLVQPPRDFPRFAEAMSWNPLYDNDPAHRWLREELGAVAKHI